MTGFLTSNWIWILLIGAMLVMHLGHRHGGHGGGGGTGGCGGGGGHVGHDARQDDHTGHGDRGGRAGPPDERPDLHKHSGHDQAADDAPAPPRRHGGC
ncbi:hypothetical protein SMIR_41605 (plasmid) [Streptomyces mirabilis]|uniref:hypothetical protein n=1 Tax=Streptomyces mirabilis TaxID=68239 RepID=UPI001BAEC3F9|nr:hypothetical protein [Streptomyces mirabilis]QUW85554.1 hypothetical protein SMIR_41605 [Streptomyces mirabilis]